MSFIYNAIAGDWLNLMAKCCSIHFVANFLLYRKEVDFSKLWLYEAI